MKVLSVINPRSNPVVSKELLQSVRAGSFTTIMIAMMLAQVAILLYQHIKHGKALIESESLGRNTLFWQILVLNVAGVGLVPLVTMIRLFLDSRSRSLELLFISPLPRHSIVFGKFYSGMAINFLLFGAAGPYLLCTYLFRGIDLISVFMIVGNGFLASTIMTMLACLFGGTRGTLRFRVGLQILFALIVFIVISILMQLFELYTSFAMAEWFITSSGLMTGVVIILMTIVFTGTLGGIAGASMTSRFLNRAYFTRLWASIGAMAAFVFAIIASIAIAHPGPYIAWKICAWGCVSVLWLSSLFDPKVASRLVLPLVPKTTGRFRAFLIYSVSGGGVALATLIMLPSCLATAICTALLSHSDAVFYITLLTELTTVAFMYFTGAWIINSDEEMINPDAITIVHKFVVIIMMSLACAIIFVLLGCLCAGFSAIHPAIGFLLWVIFLVTACVMATRIISTYYKRFQWKERGDPRYIQQIQKPGRQKVLNALDSIKKEDKVNHLQADDEISLTDILTDMDQTESSHEAKADDH